METRYPYSPDSVGRVRRLLQIAQEGSNPQAFEVFADGVRLVPRTAKLELYDEAFENMLPEDFAAVEVKIYYGSSNLNDNYILFTREEKTNAQQNVPFQQQKSKQQNQRPTQFEQQQFQQPLGESGQQQWQQNYQQPQQQPKPINQPDDVDKKIQSALEAERTKWKNEKLESDNAELREDLKEKDRYIQTLETALLEANKGNAWKENLEGLITNGLKIYQTIQGIPQPQAQGLGNPPQQQASQQTTASYEEEEEEPTEFEKRLRAIIEHVNETFNPYQAQAFIDLLNEAVSHKKLIVEMLAILKARLYGKRFKRQQRREQNRNAGPQPQQQNQQSQQPFTVVQSDNNQPEILEEEEEDDDNDTNQ